MNVLGIGTDIVETLRIAQMIERHGELFVGRVYTPVEIEYCRSRRMATQHFAGRWAAKEAVLKALGTGWTEGIAWTEVEVLRLASGEPRLLVTGRAAEVAAARGIGRWLVSMSHSGTHAIGSAIALSA